MIVSAVAVVAARIFGGRVRTLQENPLLFHTERPPPGNRTVWNLQETERGNPAEEFSGLYDYPAKLCLRY